MNEYDSDKHYFDFTVYRDIIAWNNFKDSQKIKDCKMTKVDEREKQQRVQITKPIKKKKNTGKYISDCPHTERNFYAKGMCR